MADKAIPITVFTGFLGSGKTTIILGLLKTLPTDYKVCLLKNEFGDVAVDSELAKEGNIEVQEMLNGCMCCVLIGQMKLGLLEIKEKYNPDRIIIETSGSAFPAPIAWQIRQMENDGFVLDSIVTVIDCVNFQGYEDVSYTAKLQAQYTDLILLNKHELVSERDMDRVMDRVNDLNTDTPKVLCYKDGGVSPDLMFGIDTKLFQLEQRQHTGLFSDKTEKEHAEHGGHDHHENEVDLIQVLIEGEDVSTHALSSKSKFEAFLKTLDKESVYRLKGLVRLTDVEVDSQSPEGDSNGDQPREGTLCIVNHAFGRWTITPIQRDLSDELDKKHVQVKITVMGLGLYAYKTRIQQAFGAADSEVTTHWAHR
ncbi:hypothetical protein BGW42_002487 [Actinomortierella wolfii]|nr:hypothetical protein BGW42_002487 [Actinomortierella wolfii]